MPTKTEDTEKLLITLLARERALFSPFRQRHWGTRATAGIWELQQQFRLQGLPWTIGGNVNARKTAETQISELRAAGLIETDGKTKGRHIRLTDRGRQVAVALCGAPGLADARRAVLNLLQFAPAGRLVSELLPAGLKNFGDPGYQEKLFDFQFIAMPAIVAGWLEVFSDCYGRAAYRVTAAGKVAARGPQPGCPPETENPEGAALFDREYAAERDRLLFARPSHKSEIGPIPLSAGAWDEIAGPWNRKPARKTRSRKAKK